MRFYNQWDEPVAEPRVSLHVFVTPVIPVHVTTMLHFGNCRNWLLYKTTAMLVLSDRHLLKLK